ncbi:MAG: NUDIX hydrolase [Phycisphaeraceae bacterium]
MQEPTETIIDRHAARVVLLDRHERILLFRCQEPGEERAFWITPGGGLEGDETHEQAAKRELYEETGLANVALSPCIWQRSHTFPWLGKTYRQHERFFLVQIESHTVDIGAHTEDEKLALTEYRWWSTTDIKQATETFFAPSRLGVCLDELLANRPSKPIDVGA